MEIPKLSKVKDIGNHRLEISYDSGETGILNFSDYYDINLVKNFASVEIDHEWNVVKWSSGLEIDSKILYSIITMSPLIIDKKKVFDPSLGKNSWL